MKKLFTYIGYFLAACTLLGTLYGIFKAVDKLANVVEKQDIILQKVDTLSVKVEDLYGQVNAISDNTVKIGNYVEGVKSAFDYHVKRSPEVTKEDYANMMQIIEELKKNDSRIAQR